MAAVVRIKRRFNEEPHSDAFILKKRKTDDNAETSTVLRFAGTVDQKENITKEIANFQLTKDAARDIVNRKRPETGVNARINQNREKSQQNRFRIVNCNRLEESSASTMTIMDVEREPQQETPVASTAAAASSSYSDLSEEPYVYDLYIADSSNGTIQYTDALDLNDLSILDYEDHLFSQHRLVPNDDDDDASYESDDSNAEAFYKNDYPDEHDSDVEEMGEIVNGMGIGNELSSDDECDGGFVYSIDSEGFAFEDDLDYGYVDRRGEGYARYHRKVKRDLENADDDDDDDDGNNNKDMEADYYSD